MLYLSTQIPHYMPMVVSNASWNTSTALPRNDYIHVDIKMHYFSPKLPHWASFCPTYHIINQIISILMKLKLINFSKIFCAVINFSKWSYFTIVLRIFYKIISHAEILYWISYTLKYYQLQWVKFSAINYNMINLQCSGHRAGPE